MRASGLLLRLILGMLLQGRSGRGVFGFAASWNSQREGICQVEADEGLGLDLDLFAARDGVGTGSDGAAGSGSDGCAFASADDSAEDGADRCSAADFFCGVLAASLALDAVGIGVDGDGSAVAIDAGQFDSEQRTAFVVGGFLNGDDAAGDGRSGADDDDAIRDDIRGDDAGECFALLGSGAVKGLGDANRDRSSGVDCHVTEGWRGWWWGRQLRGRRGRGSGNYLLGGTLDRCR